MVPPTVDGAAGPSLVALQSWLSELTAQGVRLVRTGALGPTTCSAYEEAGFARADRVVASHGDWSVTLDTFVVSFFVLSVTGVGGDLGHTARISGGIASVEIVTKIVLYYLHERVWARIALGRPRPMSLEESAAENVP